jgi:signal peptidase
VVAVRVARVAGRAVLWAAIGAVAVLIGALAVPLAFGARPLSVLSGSMEPAIHTGDVVVSRPIPPLAARVGDVVTFHDPQDPDRLITHRVRRIHTRGPRVEFVTKGDANNAVERWSVARNGHIGRALYRLPKLGYGLVLAHSRTGLLLAVGVPLLLLAVLEVASIWMGEGKEAPREPA